MFLLSYFLKLKNKPQRTPVNKIESTAKKINKLIKLDKPLVIFSLEATGRSISEDKIIEIAYLKIWKDGRIKKDNFLINPEIEISRELSEVHGIKNEDVKNKPTFKEKSQELWGIFLDCHYGGFDIINFILPILKREFLRAGIDFNYSTSNIIDSRIIYSHMEPRTLSSTYKYYCKKDYNFNIHNALDDVKKITEILENQMQNYKETRDWDFLFKTNQVKESIQEDRRRKFYWKNGETYFSFSKYINMPVSKVAEIDPKFLRWIIGAGYSEKIKNIIGLALRKAKKKKH